MLHCSLPLPEPRLRALLLREAEEVRDTLRGLRSSSGGPKLLLGVKGRAQFFFENPVQEDQVDTG